MGTRVIFELAREIRRRSGREPRHLFFAACNAPQLPEPPRVHGLPEAEFINVVGELGGTPEEVLQDKELMSIFIPLLRADYELKETYNYYEEQPFNCPISALSGRCDPETSHDGMEAWTKHGKSFDHVVFDSGHFFLRTHQDELLQYISRLL